MRRLHRARAWQVWFCSTLVFSLFTFTDGQLQNNAFSDLFPKRR
jgi:hypothetical protein